MTDAERIAAWIAERERVQAEAARGVAGRVLARSMSHGTKALAALRVAVEALGAACCCSIEMTRARAECPRCIALRRVREALEAE